MAASEGRAAEQGLWKRPRGLHDGDPRAAEAWVLAARCGYASFRVVVRGRDSVCHMHGERNGAAMFMFWRPYGRDMKDDVGKHGTWRF